MLEPPCEDDVAVDPLALRCELSERHAHLKCYPGLLRKNANRPNLAKSFYDVVEQRSDLWSFAGEVVLKIVAATGV